MEKKRRGFLGKQRRNEGIFGDFPTNAKKVAFKVDFRKEEMPFHIRVNQNVENVAVAKEVMKILGYEFSMQLLEDFQPLPHRMEYCGTIKGIHCYNDSKATNVNATWYALNSFDKPIIWIAGGRGDNDYSELDEPVAKNVVSIIAIGEEADNIFNHFASKVRCYKETTLEDAVWRARKIAQKGEIVLFTPACKSFDMFINFEHRGEVFKQIVRSLI